MINKEKLLDLLMKHQANLCTEEEIKELELWYGSLNNENRRLSKDEEEFLVKEMYAQFSQKLKPKPAIKLFYRNNYSRISIAASIIITLGFSLFVSLMIGSKTNSITKLPAKPNQFDVFAPNTSRANITLGDGSVLFLDSINSGMLINESNVSVIKTKNGQIIYRGKTNIPEYNTLINPKGSKVQVLILSDGTKVWLNNESSIYYPIAFLGSERKVRITGEAYFEVAKDPKKPFKVDVDGKSEIEVLGTHFNVNSYRNEETINATLIEGSIKISALDSKIYLKPGHQAKINTIGKITIDDSPDLEEVMAWKNGRFFFGESLDLAYVMQQIARWYDLEVEFREQIQAQIGGSIQRDVPVSQVFQMLEETGPVHFELKGSKVIVMSKNKLKHELK